MLDYIRDNQEVDDQHAVHREESNVGEAYRINAVI